MKTDDNTWTRPLNWSVEETRCLLDNRDLPISELTILLNEEYNRNRTQGAVRSRLAKFDKETVLKEMNPAAKPGKTYTLEEENFIWKLHKKGLTFDEIQKELAINFSTIRTSNAISIRIKKIADARRIVELEAELSNNSPVEDIKEELQNLKRTVATFLTQDIPRDDWDEKLLKRYYEILELL